MKRRAIVSVSNKTGVVDFCRGLVGLGFQVVSTGGTADALRKAEVSVTDVSEVTGLPECFDGRVKTLHHKLLAGVLARSTERDQWTLMELGTDYVDLVVVNLYPFQDTVAKPGCTEEEAIENIDIGGPTMLRAAAKNSDRVTVVVDPADYDIVLAEFKSNGDLPSHTLRRRLMAKVFELTAAYDAAIAAHFGGDREKAVLKAMQDAAAAFDAAA